MKKNSTAVSKPAITPGKRSATAPALTQRRIVTAARPGDGDQKWMVNKDTGQTLPYNEHAFRANPGKLTVVGAMPTSHINLMNKLKGERAHTRKMAEAALLKFRMEDTAKGRAQRKLLATAIPEGSDEASDLAQQQADIAQDPNAFLISTATVEEMIDFAKEELGIELTATDDVETMREELAVLLSVDIDPESPLQAQQAADAAAEA